MKKDLDHLEVEDEGQRFDGDIEDLDLDDPI